MADFTNDARLKDCPICQGHAHIAEVEFSKGAVLYFAACDDQDCRMFEVPGRAHYHAAVDEAVAAWNGMPRWYERDELIRDMWHAGAFSPGAYCADGIYELEKRTNAFGIGVD